MPDLSVIIASVNGWPDIAECLSALEQQEGAIDYEIVVANRCQDGTADYISQRFPRVKLLQLPNRSIPELRAAAMAQAKGDIIAVTEDHCIAPRNWLAEIVKAHRSGCLVVGGAVENGKTDRIIDWSVFLCEYSSAMLPISDGEVEDIPGNNAAYRREVLDLVDDQLKRNVWEFFVHRELRKRGVKFFSVPSIVVMHKKEFRFFYFLSQRFHYSRSFAGMRRGIVAPGRCLFYLLASPFLPLITISRIGRDVFFKKKRHYKEFILSLPLLSIIVISYALGEFVGYLFGSGGSLNKVQ